VQQGWSAAQPAAKAAAATGYGDEDAKPAGSSCGAHHGLRGGRRRHDFACSRLCGRRRQGVL